MHLVVGGELGPYRMGEVGGWCLLHFSQEEGVGIARGALHWHWLVVLVCVSVAGTAKRCYTQNVCVHACVCPLLVRQKGATHTVCVCACACVCVLCWYGKKVLHTECLCVCARACVYAYMCACLSAVNHTVGSVNKLRTSFGLKSAWTLVLGVSPPFLPLAITPRQPMYG